MAFCYLGSRFSMAALLPTGHAGLQTEEEYMQILLLNSAILMHKK
jgi:hypothetical protein